MGGFKKYDPNGGFSEYLYRQIGDTITVGGLTVKIVTRIDDDAFHSSLPMYSGKSDAYAKCSDKGDHEVEQLRIYKDRKACMDFDWGHAHGECKSGVVHVHIAPVNGNIHKYKDSVRYMNNDEIAMYGPLIKLLNPNAKFRP